MRNRPYFILLPLKICLFLLTSLTFLCHGEDGRKVQLSLISESSTVGSDNKILLGLRVKIAPGWKTYWRSPGVSGYGLNLAWDGSKNIQSIKVLWPLPKHIRTQMGVVNAYEGDLVFPLVVELKDPNKPLHASLQVDMLVCDDANCLPIMEDLNLDLPAGSKTISSNAKLIQQALTKLPKTNVIQNHDLSPISIESVIVSGANDIPPVLMVTLTKSKGIFSDSSIPDLFMEIKDGIIDASKIELSSDKRSVIYYASVYPNEHRHPTYMPDLVDRPVTLTIGYNDESYEAQEYIKIQRTTLGFWIGILFIAFIGGLILNVMPCVLPVLSLKVLSVMRHGGGRTAAVRNEFLSTVLGIIFSFLVLAGAAILLKISGRSVGWGVQFQDPYFLIALIGVLTLFACNLFGFFEFRLPSVLTSFGIVSTKRERLLGSFLEGSLVTALATPCTAPFLGTAVAFALSRGMFEIIAIFFAMGLGLSFPFLLIALFPKVATALPKPGAWMVKVKYGLGHILVLTAVWLVYVLIAEIGKAGAFIVAILMLVISLVLKNTRDSSEARKKIAWLGASILVAASFMLPTFMNHSISAAYMKDHKIWHKFEPERIDEFVKAGKIVLVTVTADWCLTCQANKYFVLNSKSITQELKNPNVMAMEADWTNHDPKITAYLKSFNQYGIPFYAIYGCKTPFGKFLGQILTPQKVLDALRAERCPNIINK